jgi:lycopene beta-cyclase
VKSETNVIILGAGLSGALLAFRWKSLYPQLTIQLLERNTAPIREKTWSFHEADVAPEIWHWLAPLASATWDGYEVCFPGRPTRTLSRSRYASIKGEHLLEKCELDELIRWGAEVRSCSRTSVELYDGTTLSADLVIDARGEATLPSGGFQKFLGQNITLKEPHQLKRPLLMDATVTQSDGFRFFYLLPWDSHSLLVEDTYYSNTSDIDPALIRKEIEGYIAKKGWVVEKIQSEEKGVLPLPTTIEEQSQNPSEPLSIGMRGALYHPVTSYSVPWAATIAHHLTPTGAHQELEQLKRRLNKNHPFYFLLNRMLFEGAEPAERWKVLARFYGLPEPLIQRFYGGKTSFSDKVRIFAGKPPLPLNRALQVLLSNPRGKEALA